MEQGTEGNLMRLLTRSRSSACPDALQSPPSQPCGCSDPKASDTWDYGFKRIIPQSPPFGAGILAITVFFFIAFFSNVLLSQINLATLGITVTIGTFGILAIILLILFLF